MKKDSTGIRIRALRKSLDMSQKEFAEAAGITQGSLSQYERNLTIPSMDAIVCMANAGNVTADWLCGLSEDFTKREKPQHYLIYKIFYGEELVYVGRTSQPLEKQLYGHFSKAPMMRYVDARQVSKVEYAEFKTQADMFLYDIYFINKWKPKLNKNDASSEPLTVELPPVSFQEFDCELLSEWKEMAEKKARASLEYKLESETLEELKRETRKTIFQDHTLTKEEKNEKYWQWMEEVYEPQKEKLAHGASQNDLPPIP